MNWEPNKMSLDEYRKQIKSSLFADRETLSEAFDYAVKVANASDNPAAVMTAVWVVVNTISKELGSINEVDQGSTV